jgi:NhaA family Na+:H+ antiporter
VRRSRITLSKLFIEFFDSEQSSGIVLILCTLASLAVANSSLGPKYLDFWHTQIGFAAIGKLTIEHWINDGLMAIFFLLVGLEIERELYIGELSDLKNASLPIIAAAGGMAVPALVHVLLNRGTPTQAGFGIAMATDIAFALGALSLLGNRVPASLKVFLTALAIIDDVGAILVIALFYGKDVSVVYLGAALGIFGALVIMNRLGIYYLSAYLIPGLAMWYYMLESGIHPTIVGVLLAFAIPFARGDEQSPSYRLQHFLHKPVAFGVMPIFALANTAMMLGSNWLAGLMTPNSLGIFLGLFAGKPLGITSFSYLAVRSGVSQLPGELTWKHLIGAGFLGGIGFTMSIFIALLAFDQAEIIEISKITILLSSFLAGTTGFVFLKTQSS